MGRTKRARRRKKLKPPINYLNSEEKTIRFVQWMRKNDWKDICKLRIAEFPQTERGVLSLNEIKPNDILLEVPLNLMITYKTLSVSQLINDFLKNSDKKFKLSIHEMLAIFVIFEFKKGQNSEWYIYLSYLPAFEDIFLPWFCSEDEINSLPEDLKNCIVDSKQNLVDSWNKLKDVFVDNQTTNSLVTKKDYYWAYTIVNTRAVYIDPIEIRKMSNNSLEDTLSDDPTMALCPYLDMFNHTSTANVRAILKPDETVPKYCLVTENHYESYEEIFISYGAHDNKKLLCQYGFILPQNQFDSIDFTLKEILEICKINASSKQYKFLCDHGFNRDLGVNSIRFSFNLAACLYVLSHENEFDWAMRVYTSNFTRNQLRKMYSLAEILLKAKLKKYESDLDDIKSKVKDYGRHFEICLNYLKYRVDFLKDIIDVKC